MSKPIDEMDAQELNESILIALGYEKLPLPAIPQWQKPGDQLFYVPQYSTSIAAAFELVEDFTDYYIEKAGNNYCVNLMDATNTVADSLPLAICRAWLKWKEMHER